MLFFWGQLCAASALGNQLQIIKRIESKTAVVELAKLEIIPAESANNNRFHTGTIAGYPVVSRLFMPGKREIKAVTNALLNPRHYAHMLKRCRIASLYGLRIVGKEKVVEFAYSKPCMRIIWSYPTKTDQQTVSGIIAPEVDSMLMKIFSNYLNQAGH